MSTTRMRQGDVERARRNNVSDEAKVTEHEGMLLALVLRQQPVTAYQLFRMFEQSPVTSINSSKGQLYPAIRRLRERGLLDARKVAGDGRKSEALSVTAAGREAVRAWTRNIEPVHIVLDDPFARGSCRSMCSAARSAWNGWRERRPW